jgi:hypothetical protein
MSVKTRPQALHIACSAAIRATSQILGESPKRFCPHDNTGRMAKIRLRVQQARKIRRKHGYGIAPNTERRRAKTS